MSFLWPAMLWLLALVPLLVWGYLALQQRRKRFAARFGSLGLVQAAQGRGPGLRRHIPAMLFLASLVTLLVALARPQAEVSLPRLEATVVLAFDVSASMAADDVAPSRMEAARAAALHFVERQPPGVRIGVVAFSNSGIGVQVPTDDQDAVMAAIQRLAPQRGTSLGHGILASLNAIAAGAGLDGQEGSLTLPPDDPSLAATPPPLPPEMFESAVIVLLSDGENTQAPDPLEAALAAQERHVRIYTVGVGSTSGATLNIDGFMVHSALNEGALEQIAAATGGAYFRAESQDDLDAVYHDLESQLVVRAEKMEITSLLAGAGIILMLIGGTLSLVWFGRLP